jgi:hypothetical protein
LITDTGPESPFSHVALTSPDANNDGQTVFFAQLKSSHYGLFTTKADGTFNTVVDDTGPYVPGDPPGPGYGASINDAGIVAFRANLATGGSGVFTRDGEDPVHPIATTEGAPFDNFSSFPTINAAGTVAFRADLTGGGQGVWTGHGGLLTLLAATGNVYSGFGGATDGRTVPTINAVGMVAFTGSLTDGGQRIVTINSHNGNTTTVADTNDGDFTDFFPGLPPDQNGQPPSLNDAGTVGFWAGLGEDQSSYNIRHADGKIEQIAATNATDSPFTHIVRGTINNHDQVAILADQRGGPRGIFNGADPTTDKVIARGDPLFGSTLTATSPLFIGWNGHGINDAGSMVIAVQLEDGREVIVRADPDGNAPAGFPPPRNRAGLVHSGMIERLPGGVNLTQQLNGRRVDPLGQPTDGSLLLAMVDIGPVVSQRSERLSTHLVSPVPGEIFDRVFADFETRSLGEAMTGT